MTINEIFPNPTVKHVIFQIRYPNLFYIENKIGDFQMKIMEEFPESKLVHRRHVVFADSGLKGKLKELPPEFDQGTKKIWQFSSEKKVQLNVVGDSLDINSQFHKTYNIGDENKFRDVIKSVMDSFLEITSIPTLNSIGLRYIDECPLPEMENEKFCEYYNSTLPIDRFNLNKVKAMESLTVTEKNSYTFRYMESIRPIDEKKPINEIKPMNDQFKLLLDFDCFTHKIKSQDYLTVTDDLHKMISEEYEKTIKEPVYEYMRKTEV